jgi:hypothetical protein
MLKGFLFKTRVFLHEAFAELKKYIGCADICSGGLWKLSLVFAQITLHFSFMSSVIGNLEYSEIHEQ